MCSCYCTSHQFIHGASPYTTVPSNGQGRRGQFRCCHHITSSQYLLVMLETKNRPGWKGLKPQPLSEAVPRYAAN
ncbi:hypothetical protein I7I48_07151 [Histoplasma ohiense]|nr:hypothetical protein I7I48_07151 [Histoplasma ohiense (nom. inval.)]